MKRADRTDRIAEDLFSYGGATYSITKLSNFLGVSHEMATKFVYHLQPVCGTKTGRRYYYRDLAEVIARGTY